ncbi:MAG: SCO family protein [Pseudomonadota bacterium]
MRWSPPLVAAALGAAVFWQVTDGLRAITTEGARRLAVAEAPLPVPVVMLETMDTKQVPLTPQDGEVVLVEFIFTTCPVICQVAAIDFAALRDRLVAEGAQVRMISVSFDPERDDPEAMLAYGEGHGADGKVWTVARPAPADLPALLDTFGVTVIPDEWEGFEHNAAIHLIDPTGHFSAVFDTDAIGEAAEAVAERS